MKHKQMVNILATCFFILFGGIAGYVVYFTTTSDLSKHPYNKRLVTLESEVVRGAILDSSGEKIAYTEAGKRQYPYGRRYAHIVGYAAPGKFGLEDTLNRELINPDYNISALIKNMLDGEPLQGRSVQLTLDSAMQKAAQDGLGNDKGAVVVIEHATGQIKALYSSPTFDPNTVEQNFNTLINDEENAPLFNRATKGLYPPGSIFKLIPAAIMIEEGLADTTYNCTGHIEKDGHTIRCFNGVSHGQISLEEAVMYSCNTYFVHLSDIISANQLQQTAEGLLFNQRLPLQMDYNRSLLDVTDNATSYEVLASYIGQGKTVVTPIHMAMLVSIIANDGVLMQPYVWQQSLNEKGKVLEKNLPVYEGAYMAEETAEVLRQYMLKVVNVGTASSLKTNGLTVGGKTGTAQNETGQDHSWFIGFVENETTSEGISFAIIVENGGANRRALEVTQYILNTFYQNGIK